MARVAVDCDGVLYDFVRTLRRLLVQMGYDPATLPEPKTWKFFPTWGLTAEQFQRICDDAVDRGILFMQGAPIPGSKEALDTLVEHGHSIHIVTARNFGEWSEINTRRWLDDYKIQRSSITFAHDKSILDADIFVDDKPANVDALRAAGKEAWLIKDHACLERRDHVGHPWLVETWEEFISICDSLEEQNAA